MPWLTLENLVKRYGGRTVVDQVSLKVESGAVVGLLGPNGAGKTTTFYMTVGLIRPESGRVRLAGVDLTDYPMYMRARAGVGYLPQEASVFQKLTVTQNVMAVLEYQPISRARQRSRAAGVLKELGIAHLARQKAGLLSGGERRRLEISRALAVDPAFILLDEPFAGIDPLAVIDIKSIIVQLKEKGIGIIISDHNVRETLGVCDTAYILDEGKIIESGTPAHIASSATAKRRYLGDGFTL